jgi:protein FAM50
MAAPSDSRFTTQGKTTTQRLSTNTVGLVALSDYRKRRADVLEQQEKDARNAIAIGSGTATPDSSQTATPNPASDLSEAERLTTDKKKKKRIRNGGGNKLSFGLDEDSGEEHAEVMQKKPKPGFATKNVIGVIAENGSNEGTGNITANAAVKMAPRVQTKASLRKEAAEREVLRREFLVLQTAVKATEIAIPFVFYDGTNIPGGTVRVKKGDFIWVFLDKSRKLGADLGVGGDKISNVRREWARVGVDDLMLVRGNIIIPHVCNPSPFSPL